MSWGGKLDALAQRYGIATHYFDFSGQRHVASPETHKALLRANGLTVDNDAMVHEALEYIDAKDAARQCPIEVVLNSNTLNVLWFAFGTHWQVTCVETGSIAAEGHVQDQITLPPLASGIYDLAFSGDGRTEFTTLLVAPARSPSIANISGVSRQWGISAALYALRSQRNSGLGDFEDLACLGEGLASNGACFLGINPVHAIGTMAANVISPYSPSHRGMLNAAYIALDRIPGIDYSDAGLSGNSIAEDARQFSENAQLIDYQSHKVLHDQRLEALFGHFTSQTDATVDTALRSSEIGDNESVSEFALYETISELHGADWREWPAEFRHKDAQALLHVKEKFNHRLTFHRWKQWLADRQLSDAQARLKQSGMPLGLYLDLAVGSRHGGAESWCENDVIASGVSIGAPPDHFNPVGQNWGLTAMAPRNLQAQRYAAFRQVLRASMRHAGLLRIDHVLGLNRSFWIPDDGSPGAYVHQPFDSLMAVIKIEAERSATAIIGEDLGLVPEGFRDTTRNSGFYGYTVMQFEKEHNGDFRNPAHYGDHILACFGTHDTPTLRGFGEGRDIDWWSRLNWIDEGTETHFRQQREHELDNLSWLVSAADNNAHETESEQSLCHAVHSALAHSPAALVCVQLDDVLHNLDAQNLPGTTDEHPNWRTPYQESVEELASNATLGNISDAMRHSGRSLTCDNQTS